jgi:protein-S-isoprenylcysteine O-methyltransferase Ste14
MKLFKADNGMDIGGQGPKIMRFAFPSAVAAVLLQFFMPNVAQLPIDTPILKFLGIGFLFAGAALWLPAIVQLLAGFPKGKLVKTGVYAVCRNPMYSSFALFLLPGISFVTGTWVYLVVAIFIGWGISRYIRPEEEKLKQVFGAEYETYMASVSRIIPFVKP